MAAQPQLDASRCSRKIFLILFLVLALAIGAPSFSQQRSSDQARLDAAQSALDAGKWAEAASLARGPANQSPDLDFLAGLAFAHLEKWPEAQSAFLAGFHKSPRDPRFPVALAGVAYKQEDYRSAKKYLHSALALKPGDSYTREFLATIYFLEGNLEAALKYWNTLDKPRLRTIQFDPPLNLNATLRTRAIAFNAPQVLNLDALLATQARLDALGIFSSRRFQLIPTDSDDYDLTLHLAEKNGFGDSWLEGLLSFFSGLPYDTVYPEFYNFDHSAINAAGLTRWDPQKRRAFLEVGTPIFGNPAVHLRVYADARNENWNVAQTFSGASSPLTNLNLRRAASGAEVLSMQNGRWSWTAGAEFAGRNFRNLAGVTSPAARTFFTNSTSLTGWLGIHRTLLFSPEHRFALDSSLQIKAGREFSSALGPFAAARGSLAAHWLPRATGDDYEMHAQLRLGALVGKATLDELYQLGLERDNDLWLRGTPGTTDGRKGAAPLGRRYLLVNGELDKNIYQNGFFTIKLGPFLDNGAIADSSGFFGSQRWLWDAGAQCKFRVLTRFTVVLSYGRDLHRGKNVFYGTTLR